MPELVNVKAINDERFARWKIQFNRHDATPVIMVGVRHNANSGQLFLLTTEDRTDEEVVVFLKGALQQLLEGMQ